MKKENCLHLLDGHGNQLSYNNQVLLRFLDYDGDKMKKNDNIKITNKKKSPKGASFFQKIVVLSIVFFSSGIFVFVYYDTPNESSRNIQVNSQCIEQVIAIYLTENFGDLLPASIRPTAVSSRYGKDTVIMINCLPGKFSIDDFLLFEKENFREIVCQESDLSLFPKSWNVQYGKGKWRVFLRNKNYWMKIYISAKSAQSERILICFSENNASTSLLQQLSKCDPVQRLSAEPKTQNETEEANATPTPPPSL